MKRRNAPPPSAPAQADAPSAHASEAELKLALPGADPARVADQLAQLGLVAGLPVSVQRLTNTYFDTPTQALHQARAALRIRRQEADGAPARWLQTLKTADAAQGGFTQRGEWEAELPGDALSFTALEAAPPWAALDADGHLFAELAPVFVTEATRTLRELSAPDGGRIELVLDVGRVRAGPPGAETSVDLCELELELLAGTPDALFAAADQIAQHLAGTDQVGAEHGADGRRPDHDRQVASAGGVRGQVGRGEPRLQIGRLPRPDQGEPGQ